MHRQKELNKAVWEHLKEKQKVLSNLQNIFKVYCLTPCANSNSQYKHIYFNYINLFQLDLNQLTFDKIINKFDVKCLLHYNYTPSRKWEYTVKADGKIGIYSRLRSFCSFDGWMPQKSGYSAEFRLWSMSVPTLVSSLISTSNPRPTRIRWKSSCLNSKSD